MGQETVQASLLSIVRNTCYNFKYSIVFGAQGNAIAKYSEIIRR
jgi:hypothetical protein